MSQITTHILDTAEGRPAAGIHVSMDLKTAEGWKVLARGMTDADGRVTDLLPRDIVLPTGTYRLVFETEAYFQSRKILPFYPRVDIQFNIRDTAHYHVPLLLSPYGYSTYRGS
jgi:5-hydroxyisourate hydrolase